MQCSPVVSDKICCTKSGNELKGSKRDSEGDDRERSSESGCESGCESASAGCAFIFNALHLTKNKIVSLQFYLSDRQTNNKNNNDVRPCALGLKCAVKASKKH